MSIGPVQIILILVVIVLLFGRGKISELMGDVAKGIKSFKKGMAEDVADAAADEKAKTIDHEDAKPEAKADAKTKAET